MHRPTVHAGFTLLELLAVIATIAVITGLLFPVLDKGKRNAQTAYDLNNNKQIVMAAQMYAADNDDYLPQPGWGTDIACWAAGANVPPGAAPATLAYYTQQLPKQLESFRKGQLYPYLKDAKLLQCPADNVVNLLFLQRNIYFCSYVWNAAVIGFPSRAAAGKLRETFKLRDFRPTALLQWEADETRPYCFNDFANYPDQGASLRHENGSTVGRFDGGAERLPFSAFAALAGPIAADLGHAGLGWRNSRIPAPNLLWCSPVNKGVPDGSGNPGY